MTIADILQSAGYPRDTLVVDFETFFAPNYTLRDMSIVEYVDDPRFEFTGLGVKINDDKSRFTIRVPWMVQRLQRKYGDSLEGVTVVVKNSKFDILILAEKFGIYPPHVIDVEDLSRYYDPRMSQKLKDLVKTFKLRKPKGDTLQFKGQHPAEIDMAAMKEYCLDDVDLEYELLEMLLPIIDNPETEFKLMQHTLNLYLHPPFDLDVDLAKEISAGMQRELRNDLLKVRWVLGYATKKKKTISEILRARSILPQILADALPEGEVVPMKQGKNKMIPALAQEDIGFQLLLVHPVEKVRDLMAAKAAVTSWPLHQAKVDSIIAQAACSGDHVRVPIKYYGAHTGRWSGTAGVNLLNLGGKGRGRAIHPLIGRVRNALKAPPGYMLVIPDSAQIEARELAWVAGQDDLTKGFADGQDIYSVFATRLFGAEVRKPKDGDSPEGAKILTIRRGFGKDAILGCIAAGSPVLTKAGWKAIERIAADDLLWDGQTWVKHEGLVDRGIKSCVKVRNIWMTPEHEVLTEGGWTTAAELSTSNLKSEVNMAISPLQRLRVGQRGELSPSNAVAPVVDRLLRQETVWSGGSLHAVMCVLKRHPGKLRAIRHLYPRPTKNDFLTEFVRSLAAVKRNRIRDMAEEVSEYGPIGSQIESLFLSIWRLYQGGIIRTLKSTESKMIGDTNLVILDSPQDQCKCGTRVLTTRKELELTPSVVGVGSSLQELASYRSFVASTAQAMLPTYDILLAGPRKRFQVGNLMVSNCGFGMGTNTFILRCKQNPSLRPLFDSGEYDWDFIDKLIKTYRTTHARIPEFWRTIEKCFRWVTKYPNEVISYYIPTEEICLHDGMEKQKPAIKNALFTFWKEGKDTIIQLPSGRRLFYRDAVVTWDKRIKYRAGRVMTHTWGGSLTENVIQAMCRDLLSGWLLGCERVGIPIIHHTYDELVGCVPEHSADEALEQMIEIMNTGPDWAAGLPLATEGEITPCFKK